ncbi:hypothetical protein LIER_42352 [Lithospermum erythrorhizon]|uniref:Uncharacterized protein n=1 Tax=Lithospermum erythrorhizon TaxID=34254 RepID=A0AAV3RRN8_LITER
MSDDFGLSGRVTTLVHSPLEAYSGLSYFDLNNRKLKIRNCEENRVTGNNVMGQVCGILTYLKGWFDEQSPLFGSTAEDDDRVIQVTHCLGIATSCWV